ncbi:hypothetical protein M231_00903 [Tremella mesenterica]|uniref:Chromo domain-containing protein n=1 Tax=Tremella mesenterica TaxID=5217 RepID=A0A4Q1BUG7_TREME|nr:hypothetical protein M231_00903 [Tremella mesenterica]
MAIANAQLSQVKSYNRHHRAMLLQPGDLVLLSTKALNTDFLKNRKSRKLRPLYIGPFEVTDVVTANAVTLDLPSNITIHPTINTSYLRKWIQSQYQPPVSQLPRVVHQILDMKTSRPSRNHPRGQTQYLVAWKDRPEHMNTWETPEIIIAHGGKDLLATISEESAAEQLTGDTTSQIVAENIQERPRVITEESNNKHNPVRLKLTVKRPQNGLKNATASAKNPVSHGPEKAAEIATEIASEVPGFREIRAPRSRNKYLLPRARAMATRHRPLAQ